MNAAAATERDPGLHPDAGGRAADRSRLSCADSPRTSLTGRKEELQRCQDSREDSSGTQHRTYGSRLSGVKVRHKRQVLQDMARPLKHWLYKHRDNPYPTKTEKVLLALGSHMTLVQVSNWFANARRRLKNTVRQPDLSWALRIKLYNKYIQGNAERLSVCSGASDSDGEECPLQAPVRQPSFGRSSSLEKPGDAASPPSKYKSSLLNRYLNDSLRHMMAVEGAEGGAHARKRRSHSESFSSNDCDRDAGSSPASSYETEANFVYRMDTVDYSSAQCDRKQKQEEEEEEEEEEEGPQKQDDQGWREIHAAVALTSLAQGPTAPGAAGRGPFPVMRTGVSGQSCSAGPVLTSRIIQKSSHIAEVQTVKAALESSV
ncbi:homeobox protein Mohawk-like [Salarias fasciatus]|uniref:homeobox protein Mohawk-like n=1 Tax=Salarias fasciatus TaxID=181472 RepID=UPI0011769763|nr:homeobox protein Mohawk-like [Salarias fasciatus]